MCNAETQIKVQIAERFDQFLESMKKELKYCCKPVPRTSTGALAEQAKT